MKYNHQQIGKKWQRVWEQKGAWKVSIRKARKPYYNLMMFPYPSAEGLHVGNVYAFTGSDIHGRFRRMQGFDVFEPMGFDSFGIHSENFAIKKGTHPKSQTAKNIKNFRRQLKQMGALFDWSREVVTSEPNYYKWTQWLFLQLFKAGLAYRAKAPVDWCSSCKTVLADEQVIDGKCERCVTEVIQKELEQWFFRITKYADRLLKNLERIDWSERTKIAQRNWIGEKEGINITYEIEGSGEKVVCFTTRPDTNFGATFIVIGPEHPLVEKITTAENREQVRTYVERTKKLTEEQRIAQGRAKTGVFTGSYAVNSLNGKKLPIWVSDFVLGNVGTGAVVGVPGHDMRDFEFAKTFGLPIIRVVVGTDGDTSPITQAGQVQEETGSMINSDFLNGLDIHGATKRIMAYLEEKGWGKRVISYHLRDWLISRQRYWGPPIPIIYCEKCGMVPVPEKDLPVLLPNVKDFRPTGTDKSPLASVEKFVKTKCPKCKSPARRETDVLDTFLDSAWYYLRYPSVGMQNAKIKIQNDNAKSKIIELPWNTPITKRWLPVNMYIGGQEHAVLHLLYTRFVTMALKDAGLIGFEEPFKKFRAHGLLIKEGKKMSKSKGNVVNPDEILKKYGADTLRIYLMFLGPFSEGGDWSDKGIVGIYRFLNRVWALAQDCLKRSFKQEEASLQTPSLEWLRQRTIRKVTEDLESLHYNTAIAALMEYANSFQQSNPSTTLGASIPTIQQVKTLLILLAPFAPYITEELWQKFGHKDSVHNQRWPKYDPKLIQEEKIKLILQVNGKVRYVAEVPSGITENEAGKLALENEKIKKWLAGKEPKKIIFVPDKLVNVVVS